MITNEVLICDVNDFSDYRSLGRADLIVSDPPYGRIVSESWDKDFNAYDYIEHAEHCEQLLKPGGSALIWGGIGKPNDRVFFKFLSEVEERTDLTIQNVITWSKKRAYGKANDYLFTREELVWLTKGKPKTFNVPLLDELRGYEGYNKKYPAKSKFKRRTNVWTDITEVMRGKIHPCEKPERLSEVIVRTHSNEGDLVLDLFAGSGNVSKVCKKLKRNSIAVEANAEYADQIMKALEGGHED